jgi:hypothetical protein
MSHVITFSEAVTYLDDFITSFNPVAGQLPIGGVLSRAGFLQGLAQLPNSPGTPGVRAWLCLKEVSGTDKIFIATESVNVNTASPAKAVMLPQQTAPADSAFIYFDPAYTAQQFLQNVQSPSAGDISLPDTDTANYRVKFRNEYSPLNPDAVAFLPRAESQDLADQSGGNVFINYFFGYDVNMHPNRIRLIYFAVNASTKLRLTSGSSLIMERTLP